MAADDRVCACGCGRRLVDGGRLYVSSRVKYATPACSHRAIEARATARKAEAWRQTLATATAQGLCPRCGAPTAPGYRSCADCLEAGRARNLKSRLEASPLPRGVETPQSIDARYTRALAQIRQARRAGDPRWFVDPYAQRAGYVQAQRGPWP